MTGFHRDGRNRLDLVSPSFCPLRWTYMQVDLEHGRVKACCKTPFVRIERSELRSLGVAAMFNAPYFQDRRREMLSGVWHSDCDSCWTQEQLGLLSYRRAESNREPHRSAAVEIGEHRTVDAARPKEIEFILSTLCDLKCSYCGPDFSSAWVADIKTSGPLAVLPEQADLAPACEGFRETFWEWFDTILEGVDYVQFNGGEPLIQPEFYAAMDRLAASPHAMQVGIISNLNTPSRMFSKFRSLLPRWMERHWFRLGVSQDSVGQRAEYIRHGLQWDRFDQNLRMLLDEFKTLQVRIAPTMNILNVTSIQDLLVYLDSLANEYGPRISVTPSIVMAPDFLSPFVLPPEYSRYLEEAILFLDKVGRWPEVGTRLREIIAAMKRISNRGSLAGRFAQWVAEQDARRTSKCVDVFPELAPFIQSSFRS